MKKDFKKRWTFEAPTVEEAVEKAVKELGCARDALLVKVVSEEKKGLFGMEGAQPAKIVVMLKDIKAQ